MVMRFIKIKAQAVGDRRLRILVSKGKKMLFSVLIIIL